MSKSFVARSSEVKVFSKYSMYRNSQHIFFRHVGRWTVICAPVCLMDSIYSRNSFQFTAGIIVPCHVQDGTFKAVAMHLAMAFQSLEVFHNLSNILIIIHRPLFDLSITSNSPNNHSTVQQHILHLERSPFSTILPVIFKKDSRALSDAFKVKHIKQFLQSLRTQLNTGRHLYIKLCRLI